MTELVQGESVPRESVQGEPMQGATPQAAPDPAPPPPQAPAQDRRVHVLEAAAHQRERVLSSFTDQRDTITKAVADQRTVAMAPIDAVRARLARASLRAHPLAAPKPVPAGVATEIVGILKTMIAEEVRQQLQALLAPASEHPAEAGRDELAPPANPAPPAA